jgi:hypothetical protein
MYASTYIEYMNVFVQGPIYVCVYAWYIYVCVCVCTEYMKYVLYIYIYIYSICTEYIKVYVLNT